MTVPPSLAPRLPLLGKCFAVKFKKNRLSLCEDLELSGAFMGSTPKARGSPLRNSLLKRAISFLTCRRSDSDEVSFGCIRDMPRNPGVPPKIPELPRVRDPKFLRSLQ